MEPEDTHGEETVSDTYAKGSLVVLGFALLLLIILVAVFLFKDSPEEVLQSIDEKEGVQLEQKREQRATSAIQNQEVELFIDPPRADNDPTFSPDELIVQ